MIQKNGSLWTTSLLAGIVFFIFWRFAMVSPGNLNKFGLLNHRELIYLILGVILSMMVSSAIIFASSLKTPEDRVGHILTTCSKLFICVLVMTPRIQLNAWFCWSKETLVQWMLYTYNTVRDDHYRKEFSLNSCPPDLLNKSKLLEDIELKKIQVNLMEQETECNKFVNTSIIGLIVIYVFFCNILPKFISKNNSSHDQESSFSNTQHKVKTFEVPSSNRYNYN